MKIKKIIYILSLWVLIFIPIIVSAAATTGPQGLGGAARQLQGAGSASYGSGAGAPSDVAGQLPTLVGRYIAIFLEIIGGIFLVLIVYAGYMWMMARENADQAKKAMTLMKNAVFGLVIVLAAYAISSFVVTRITSATLSS